MSKSIPPLQPPPPPYHSLHAPSHSFRLLPPSCPPQTKLNSTSVRRPSLPTISISLQKCNILPSFFPYASLSEDRQLLLDALSLVPADVQLCMPEAPTVRMIQNEIERSEAFDVLVSPALISLSPNEMRRVTFGADFASPTIS